LNGLDIADSAIDDGYVHAVPFPANPIMLASYGTDNPAVRLAVADTVAKPLHCRDIIG